MGTFAVIAEHPPELCPTSNARTRQMMKEGAPQIPQLAEQLGINIVTLRVFGPDHIVLAVVEANDIEAVQGLHLPDRAHSMEHDEDPRDLLDGGGAREGG